MTRFSVTLLSACLVLGVLCEVKGAPEVSHEPKSKVKTFETISRDGRHQMAGYGAELVLEAQTMQLIYERNLT
jgi:hypothetical protein